MTISLRPDNTNVVELQEFVDYVESNYKTLDAEALIELAPMFKALGNNRTFLEETILEELKNPYTFQVNNPYSSQSFNLCLIPGKFFIRANIWLPEKDFHKINGGGEKKLFAYYQGHDHNFDFMTIGYLGNGYVTDIYEYNHNLVKGYVGEKIDITYLETTTLPEGKIMIYRASKDIHIQKFPEDFSISLNLMAPSPLPVRDQFMIDIESGTITNIIRSSFSGRKLLLEAAGYLVNDNISDVLESIAKNHSCERTRAVAAQSLAIRWPEQANQLGLSH